MHRIKLFVTGMLLLAIVIAGIGCSSVRPEGEAPDFTLTGLDRETYTLSDFRGSPVVLNFFATWCGPCQMEVPYLQSIYADPAWQEAGITLMAVNLREPAELVGQFMDYFGLTFPALLDTDASVSRAYNVSGIPVTFFIDENGIIRSKKTGAFTGMEELESLLEDLVSGS